MSHCIVDAKGRKWHCLHLQCLYKLAVEKGLQMNTEDEIAFIIQKGGAREGEETLTWGLDWPEDFIAEMSSICMIRTPHYQESG